MFFGLDANSMIYFATAAASLAALAYTYYKTRNGIASLDLSQHDLQLIAQGAVKGVLHTENIDDIMQCVSEPIQTMESMKTAISTFSDEGQKSTAQIINGVRQLGRGFYDLAEAVKNCDQRLEGRERQLFHEITEFFQKSSMSDTCSAISLNVMVNGVDIYTQLDAAYTAYLAKEYEDFGRDMGSAFTLTFIGNSTAVTSSEASKLTNMQTAYLYPEISARYTEKDNKAYVDYLEFISKSRANPADDTLARPDISGIYSANIPQHKEVEASELPSYVDGDSFYQS